MGRTSATVKNRYNSKAYDRITIMLPKGRKQTVEAHAKSKEESVNSLVNGLLRGDIGLTEAEWKNKEE